MKSIPDGHKHRAVSVLLAFTVHAILVMALLRFMISPHNSALRQQAETHLLEMIINTARPPKPGTGREAPPSPPETSRPVPRGLLPGEPITPAVPVPAPDIRGVGQVLNGCALNNLANLNETARANCRKFGTSPGYDPGTVDYADRTGRIPGARQWRRELARKQAPLLLPCGNTAGLDIVYTGGCIIGNIANGFSFKDQYDNQPTYSDKTFKQKAVGDHLIIPIDR